jgi:co-chaperonin GroES (HSP10)
MKSINAFIIHLDKKWKDEIVVGGQKMFLDSKFDEFGNRFMEAEIVSVPLRCELDAKPGDILYFHHTVLMTKHFYLGDGKYYVPYAAGGGRNNLGHAYKNSEGIHMIDQWVFLEPMESSQKITSSLIEVMQDDVPNDRGRIFAPSEGLSGLGLNKGDVVYFSKNSDYEMEVDGQKVWRMMLDDLLYAEETK